MPSLRSVLGTLCVAAPSLFFTGNAAFAQNDEIRLLAQAEQRGSLQELLQEQQRLIDSDLLADEPLPDPLAETERNRTRQTQLPLGTEMPTPSLRPRYDPDRDAAYDGIRPLDPAEKISEGRPAPRAEATQPSIRPRLSDQQPASSAEPARAADPLGSRQRNAEERRSEEVELAEEEREDIRETLSTGGIRQGAALDPDAEDFARAAPAERVRAEQGGQELQDADPYEATGIRFGSLILRPSLETGIRTTDNVFLGPNKENAVLSETTLRLQALSDDGSGNTSVDGFYTYRKSIAGAEFSEPEAGLDARMRYELSRQYRINASLGYAGQYEGAEAPYAPGTSFTKSAFEHTLRSSLGVEKYDGPVRYTVTGEVERQLYTDAESTTGPVSQEDRNSTLFNLRLRGGYAISPAIIPFAELEVGRRIYDNRTDAGGYERAANRYALRGGLQFDMTEKLNGELAVGYIVETPDDGRLQTIDGISAEGRLTWSPYRETNVTLGLRTDVESATGPGISGSLLHGVNIGIDRRLRHNLDLSANASAERRDYLGGDDTDTILSAELGASYWLNRSAALLGRIRHERQYSTLPDRDYDASSAFVGVRIQR